MGLAHELLLLGRLLLVVLHLQQAAEPLVVVRRLVLLGVELHGGLAGVRLRLWHVQLLGLHGASSFLLLGDGLLRLLPRLLLLKLELDLPLTLRALSRLAKVQLQVLRLVLALKLAHLWVLEGILGALEQARVGLDVAYLLLTSFLQLLQLGVD